jgi:gamma-tubulin complex component 3
MSNKQNQKNLREIYDLLDKLSRKFSPAANRHKEILKKVTTGISESQHGFIANVQFDEGIILAKIKNHLAGKSQQNLATFLNLHEQLTTLSDLRFRSSILTFLLCLSDIETKLPNTFESRDYSSSNFTLPIRHQIPSSASVDQIYRTMSSHAPMSSLVSENGGSSNLRLVNYRRKIPNSTSSDSVLDGQTPDSEYMFCAIEEYVQEAIYSISGKSGKYLKKDVSGDFKLDIKARSLNSMESTSFLRIAECGRLHNEIQKYTDPNSEFFFCGLFGQGLIAQIQMELTQFYGLIAHLQDNVSFGLN